MEDIGNAFLNHYYTTFDQNRALLGVLYQSNSMMTFEGVQCLGQQAIVTKLTTLPFQQVVHNILTRDFQPGPTPNSIMVFVTGQFAVDGEMDKPHLFSQFFHLVPTAQSNYFVYNDIFRRVSVV